MSDKVLMLKALEKDFDDCMARLEKQRIMYTAGQNMRKSMELTEDADTALASELTVLKYSLSSTHGELMCIGAACDTLRELITNEAKKPEGGYH